MNYSTFRNFNSLLIKNAKITLRRKCGENKLNDVEFRSSMPKDLQTELKNKQKLCQRLYCGRRKASEVINYQLNFCHQKPNFLLLFIIMITKKKLLSQKRCGEKSECFFPSHSRHFFVVKSLSLSVVYFTVFKYLRLIKSSIACYRVFETTHSYGNNFIITLSGFNFMKGLLPLIQRNFLMQKFDFKFRPKAKLQSKTHNQKKFQNLID